MSEDQINPDQSTPLLTTSMVESWRNELAQLVEELQTKNMRADWLMRRLAAADVLIEAARERDKK